MRELGKITKNKDVSLRTKSKVMRTLISPITMHRCESWISMKTDGGKTDLFQMWRWRRAPWTPWTTRKTNVWVLQQMKPDTLQEAKMNETEAVLL